MKKKTGYILTAMTILALTTLACGFSLSLPRTVQGNGSLSTLTRPVENFSQIEFNGIGEITVELGTEESLTIEAEENLLPYLETYVRNNTLVIEIEDGRNILPTEPINFFLTVKTLEAVDVSGLGNIFLPEIDTDLFRIDISGAGNIDIDAIYAETFDANMSGLGDLTVFEGQVSSQEVAISGSGKYSAGSLESQEAEITISGLGSATLRVSDFLKVTISGGGDVNYFGDPEIDSEITGLGSLDKVGD